MREWILVLDFGGQYNQLIARRVREAHVYCEVRSYEMDVEEIRRSAPRGIILTGGPDSVYGEGAALCGRELFELGIPVLGICYGAQAMAHVLGGVVETAPVSEYGKTELEITSESSGIFRRVARQTTVWMSFMRYSSTRRCSTPARAPGCSRISCMISAAARASGRWTRS